jgi:hypothetical protein
MTFGRGNLRGQNSPVAWQNRLQHRVKLALHNNFFEKMTNFTSRNLI